MRYIIDVNTARCIACGACSVACMDQNDIEPQYGDQMLRRCVTVEKGRGMAAEMQYMSLSCVHCADAPCIRACPMGCIQKDEETGFVVYDNGRCTGCRSCFAACPFSAPAFDREGRMHKCDGCAERVKRGFLPACVKVCPMDALSLMTEAEYEEKTHKRPAASPAACAEN